MDDDPRDALDRCRAALRASEARFRNVIERNADGVVVVGLDGRVLYVNPAAERLLGCKACDCVGAPFGVPVVPDERTEVDLPRGGRPGAMAEMRVVETEWEGEPAFLASLRDVTDRKRMEEVLRETDRRKDEFLAMLAHELRNPLAAITYALPLIRPGGAHEAADEAHEIAERQVTHLARLVDDLLDVSRITCGKIELRKDAVDVSTAVNRVVEVLAPKAEARGHELSVSLPQTPVRVDADVTRLEQILSNLLNNAIKYTPDGGRIGVTVGTEDMEGVVRVRDGGIGISPEMLPHVFDLFRQADRSLDRSQGGLGIGLTLVRSLVELHGGVVTASSEGVGKGCEFAVRLPLAIRSTREAIESDGPLEKPKLSFRVLVVEDQRATAKLLGILLERCGHRVDVANDGRSALAAAQADPPEVILLDIGLPEISGYEVARRLRAMPALRNAVLVALTGYGQEEDRRRSREAGFDRHLVKPVDLATLESLFGEIERSRGDGVRTAAPTGTRLDSSESG